MKDIVSITVTMEKLYFNYMNRFFQASGYIVSKQGSYFKFSGPNITFLVRVSNQTALEKIEFSLNRIKQGQRIYKFGSKSQLEFSSSKNKAIWKF